MWGEALGSRREGIIRIGAEVRPNDILVGKVTWGAELTAEKATKRLSLVKRQGK